MPHIRIPIRIMAIMYATLSVGVVARAQSLVVSEFDPGVNGEVQAIALQSNGKIVIGGGFTTVGFSSSGPTTRNDIARVNADGTVDTSFNPGANGRIIAIAIQADGKIVVGGAFDALGGGGFGVTARRYIGRLNADGTVDPSFNPGANGLIRQMVIQSDGRILVGGAFTTVGGGGTGTTARNFIARLNADGSLDTAFNPGANGEVYAIAVQPDGQILVGGAFTALGGGTGTTTRSFIGRLNADGSLDTSFDPGANHEVYSLAIQSDARILVGGNFTTLGGGGSGTATRNSIGRLNANGTLDTGFNPGAVFEPSSPITNVRALAYQPDGKILVGGTFTALGGGTGTTVRRFLGRLEATGTVDSSFDPGAIWDPEPNGTSVQAFVIQPDGQILVAGQFTRMGGGTGTTARGYLGRLNADGTVGPDYNPGADGRVFAVAVQPDGKTLVGGQFSRMGGGATVYRNHVARLNEDGSVDSSFDAGANDQVNAIAVQPDGKILIAGKFASFGGGSSGTSTTRSYIGRLNADGSVDTTFTAFAGGSGYVNALALQADGKILVGGDFTYLNGTARKHIGRLNSDGTLDRNFDPGTNGGTCVFNCGSENTGNGIVYALAVQTDGKILVAGDFTALGGGTGTTPREYIGRLNADGSVDAGFNPGAYYPSYMTKVYALAVQPDGKILVGGFFTRLGGGSRRNIGRLNADGSLDTGFDSDANYAVWTLAVQADGKVLAGGTFTALSGGGRNRLGRVNADGSLDMSFDPGADSTVYALAVLRDGKALVGGEFTLLAGGPRASIGFLSNTDAATQSLGVSGGASVVTWSRGGSAPEVSRVTFESSTNGVMYTALGNATRIAGGWQLTGQSLPANQAVFIRARGYFSTGWNTGSGSIVESVQQVFVSSVPPVVTIHPASITRTVGAKASFATAASGAWVVQWQVANAGSTVWTDISGATSTAYSFFVAAADAGKRYRAVFTNTAGTAVSNPATLTLNGAMSATPSPLVFSAVKAVGAQTLSSQTPAQTVTVTYAGTTGSWTATTTETWLSITGGSGSAAGTFTVGIQNPADVIGASTLLSGSVTITSPGALNSPLSMPVTLTVARPGSSTQPFGAFDTPADNATGLQGSFAVTGWALDDVGIDRVEIWRELVAGEPQEHAYTTDPSHPAYRKVFIAYAFFVTGSRTDVEGLYPTAPFANRAGWGYLLLSWGLYGQGNGTYTLHAYAFDVDGHSTLLGSKTIAADNAHATKPFGAIDTPSYGGTAWGSVWNFGWALTPDAPAGKAAAAGTAEAVGPVGMAGAAATCTITNGSVTMHIDSGPPYAVNYGDLRADIAASFPGFSNGNSSGGAHYLDTTTLSNGIHQIGWLVYDNCGRGDGVGSRFFNVLNGSSDAVAPGLPPSLLSAASADGRDSVLARKTRPALMPETSRLDAGRVFRPGNQARTSVAVRQLSGEWQTVVPSSNGWHVIEVAQDGRIEVQLPPTSDPYKGEQIGASGRSALPLGSSLDANAGIFYWQPAPGFLGKYDLVFAPSIAESGATSAAVRVRVIVGPPMRAVIDTPFDDSVVALPFTIAGWALDLSATEGAGIDAVHAWAYPLTGEEPLFLGVAARSDRRDDVAKMFGDSFANASYSLSVDSLPPGTYNVVVYPHRSKTNTFDGAQVVRVVVR